MSVADLRKEYTRQGLLESDVDADPFVQFERWFSQALAAQLPEPNAMTLATATPEGRPSARTVLIKGVDARGFVFFTNYDSRKGRELAANPWAALVFYWAELERQVRVEGRIGQVDPEESDAYFASRPRGSQIGAWASHQSETLDGRETFEQRIEHFERAFEGREVPRPPRWGGFRVVPRNVEFWYGAQYRLHERWLYECDDSGEWSKRMLYP